MTKPDSLSDPQRRDGRDTADHSGVEARVVMFRGQGALPQALGPTSMWSSP